MEQCKGRVRTGLAKGSFLLCQRDPTLLSSFYGGVCVTLSLSLSLWKRDAASMYQVVSAGGDFKGLDQEGLYQGAGQTLVPSDFSLLSCRRANVLHFSSPAAAKRREPF